MRTRVFGAVVLLAVALAPVASASTATYLDPRASVGRRVHDLLARMTLEEKVGQMTQAERGAVEEDSSQITTLALGSVLSGGGSTPVDNTPFGWADMVDGYQSRALAT